jgi:hypothetical protein
MKYDDRILHIKIESSSPIDLIILDKENHIQWMEARKLAEQGIKDRQTSIHRQGVKNITTGLYELKMYKGDSLFFYVGNRDLVDMSESKEAAAKRKTAKVHVIISSPPVKIEKHDSDACILCKEYKEWWKKHPDALERGLFPPEKLNNHIWKITPPEKIKTTTYVTTSQENFTADVLTEREKKLTPQELLEEMSKDPKWFEKKKKVNEKQQKEKSESVWSKLKRKALGK